MVHSGSEPQGIRASVGAMGEGRGARLTSTPEPLAFLGAVGAGADRQEAAPKPERTEP